MNQQHAGGALAHRFLVLVQPAAIVGVGLAGEAVRFFGGRLRVVDHHDQNFSLQVLALVVVPVFFLGAHAVADEDQWRVQRDGGLAAGGAEHDVLAGDGGNALAAGGEGDGAVGQQLAAFKDHRLAIAAAGQLLQADQGGLRLQVAHRQVAAALAGAAAFEQVVGQEGHVGAQRHLGDGRGLLGGGVVAGHGQAGGEREQWKTLSGHSDSDSCSCAIGYLTAWGRNGLASVAQKPTRESA